MVASLGKTRFAGLWRRATRRAFGGVNVKQMVGVVLPPAIYSSVQKDTKFRK